MNFFIELAVKQPLLLLTTLLAIGAVVGNFKFRGFSLGPAAVLFTALALSAIDDRLVLSRELGLFGLALFAYVIGIGAGPSFFTAIRSGGRIVVTLLIALVGAAAAAVGFGRLLGLEGPVLSGLYAGALTNTPALAAAEEAWESHLPTVGYSVTYMFGVIGMLLVSTVAIRMKPTAVTPEETEPATPKLFGLTLRVDEPNLPSLGELSAQYDERIVFSRIMRGDTPQTPGVVDVATDSDVPVIGDIITVIGDQEAVDEFAIRVGHPSTVPVTLDRSHLDYRRIALSNSAIAGKPLGSLKLLKKYGATATRIRRGDIDHLAHDDFILSIGDRVRVVAPPHRMSEIAKLFGDSEKGASSFSIASLAAGMAMGVLLGLIEIPLPGGSQFALGMAGGPLIAGIILGRQARTRKVLWTLPHGPAHTLSHIGMMLFLAYAGSNSGGALADAIVTPVGWRLLVAGALVTTTSATLLLLVGHYWAGAFGGRLAGVMAGAQTQPAVLAYANERLEDDPRVNMGYAVAYPAAMIIKVLIAPILGNF